MSRSELYLLPAELRQDLLDHLAGGEFRHVHGLISRLWNLQNLVVDSPRKEASLSPVPPATKAAVKQEK